VAVSPVSPQRLTKRVVDLLVPEPADRFIWDSELKGFGLKVTPAGRKSFVAQYRNRGTAVRDD
jgi:hypothetical protein